MLPLAEIPHDTNTTTTLGLNEEEESILLSSFTTGDWSLYVHIREVADLHGENDDGTTDAVVVVETRGLSWSTRTARGARAAVYDEGYRFELHGMGVEDLACEGVVVKVVDAGGWSSSGSSSSSSGKLVGMFMMDLVWLYSRKEKEVVSTWVALFDEAKSRDKGCQVSSSSSSSSSRKEREVVSIGGDTHADKYHPSYIY